MVGWFPEAYAEPLSDQVAPEGEEVKEAPIVESNLFVSLFPYASEEPGDLTFEAGVEIEVLKKEAEWWTGQIGDRVGVFPFNYVEPVVASGAGQAPAPAQEVSPL